MLEALQGHQKQRLALLDRQTQESSGETVELAPQEAVARLVETYRPVIAAGR